MYQIKQIWQALLFINGYNTWNILYPRVFARKTRTRHRRPTTAGWLSLAKHLNLAVGPVRVRKNKNQLGLGFKLLRNNIHIDQYTHPGPLFTNQLIFYLAFMTANNNHAYLKRLFDIAFMISIIWINHESSKNDQIKNNNRHTWSVLLPIIAILWNYTCSHL